jgi:small ligand-binding sensory domain FIST
MIGEDTAIKEVAANQVFGQVPWFGLYTFGEIAPVQGKNIFHGWTSVVVAIY